MRNTHGALVLAGLMVLALNQAAQGETRLANIFNDHMVLQQGKPLDVWGWADPGAEVAVTLTENRADAVKAVGEAALQRQEPKPAKPKKDQFKTPKVRLAYVHEDASEFSTVKRQAKADAGGRWSVSFEPLKASFSPKFLCVSGDTQSAVVDVLVGEVWVTAGQSNMASGGNRSAWLDNAGLLEPAVRYTAYSSSAAEPLADLPKRSDWRICTVEGGDTLTGVSTIAYLFAKNLHRQLRVPVGVINTASGGSLGSEWTGLPELKSIDHPRVKELFTKPKPKAMPARNFNGRIAPIGRLAVRGALFMQGEQQALTHCLPRYRPIFPKIISAFRRAFGDKNLPFGIIGLHLQGAPEAEDAMANGYAIVGDIHYRTHLQTPNTGYVTGHDVSGGLHPTWKRPLAERAVLWAMTDVYGAPGAGKRERGGQRKYKLKVELNDNMVRAYLMVPGRMRGRDGGWVSKDVPVSVYYPLTYDGLPYRGFALADANGRWYPGRVKRALDVRYLSERDKKRDKIFYNCLEISHPLVKKPVAMRYGYGDGSAHLGSYYAPIPPHRTDNWPTYEMEEGVQNRPIMHQMQAVAEQDRWDRISRQTVHDAYDADMNLHATAKGMLRGLADRMTVGLELAIPGDAFGDKTAALSKKYLGRVSKQYRRPDNLWGKKALWWVKAHRLQALPKEMDLAMKDKKVAAAYAELQQAVKAFRQAVDALPETQPLPKEIRPAPLPELSPSYSPEARKASVISTPENGPPTSD
jgi:sialate O-acetylesterase